MQNVTQCYYTYITEYSEAEQEKCVDFYWKTCKIIFKERVFNATTRMCKRPLIKRCKNKSIIGLVVMKINAAPRINIGQMGRAHTQKERKF